MGPIVAIAIKDLRLLIRDRAAAFFVLVFPLFVAFFFGYIFGGAKERGGNTLDIVVVNESTGPRAAAFVSDLEADSALKVQKAATMDEGENLVRTAKAIACIEIPETFDAAMNSIFTGGGMKVKLVTDPSRRAEAGLLEGKLNQYAYMQLMRTFQDPEQMEQMTRIARAALPLWSMPADQKAALDSLFKSMDLFAAARAKEPKPKKDEEEKKSAKPNDGAAFVPVKVEVTELSRNPDEPTNAYSISFGQGIIWGLMSCVTGFGASLAEERTRGTLLRLRTAPIHRRQVLLGKALACFLSCVAVQSLLMILGVSVFEVRIPDLALAAVSILACSFGFTGLMMLLAGFSRTEAGAQGIGRAVVLVMAMIGGGTIPLFFMPPLMRTISLISPFTWAARAIEGYTFRGLSFAEMALPLGVLVFAGVAGFVIGNAVMSRED